MSVSTTPAITGIDITVYNAKDVDRAIEFYTKKLGLTPSQVWPGMGAEFPVGDAWFGLWKADEGEFKPASGVMFIVDDVAAAVAQFKALGIKFADGGKVEETPVCFMAFGEDSEGNTFILHHRKRP